MASKEIPIIKTEIDDPDLGITTNHAQRITAIVLNPFLTDMLNASKITTVADHAALKTIVDANGLIPGHGYKFTFVTKYIQPKTGTVKTAPGEDLILIAKSNNSFHGQAYSVTFPEDIIEFDFTKLVCEDFSTPRGGTITYREDTKNKLSYPGDFRGIILPFWIVDRTAFPAWATTSFYTPGNIILEGGLLYRCRIMHTAGTFATDLDNYKWENVDKIHGAAVWNTTVSILGGTAHTSGPVRELPVFENVTNCHIQGPNSATAVRHVCVRYSNNVTVGAGSEDIIIYNSYTVPGVPGSASAMSQDADNTSIGHSSTGLVIVDGSGTKIGDNCSGIFKGPGSQNNSIGDFNLGIYLGEGCTFNVIGDNSMAVALHYYCHYNIIGAFGRTINLQDFTKDCVIGTSCSNLVLNNSSFNTFESGCFDIKLRWAQYNNFGNSCSNIANINAALDYSQFSYNIFGDLCSNINTGGAGSKLTHCTFGATCTSISIGIGAVMQKCTLGNGCTSFTLAASSELVDASFGHDCATIALASGALCYYWTVGHSVDHITAEANVNIYPITLESAVNNITFRTGAVIQRVTIGESCQNITAASMFDATIGKGCLSITMAAGTTFQEASIGHHCATININANVRGAEIGHYCEALTFQATKTYNNITIATGTKNKTFASLNRVNLALAHTVSQTWTVDIADAVIDTLDSVNGKLGYITVASGAQTLVQI